MEIPTSYHQPLPIEWQLNRQVQVFGLKRMDATLGQMATETTTEAFIATVAAICNPAGEGGDRRRYKQLPADGYRPIGLMYNPHALLGYGDEGEPGSAVARAYGIQSHRSLAKPKGLPLGIYTEEETVFVDKNKLPVVRKSLVRPGVRFISQIAMKTATEQEVKRAQNVIVDAAIKLYYDYYVEERLQVRALFDSLK